MGCGSSAAKPAPGAGNKGGTATKSGTSNLPQKDSDKEGGFSAANLIVDNPGCINDFYNVDKKKLGEGSYGSVSKATNKSTNKVCAVKAIAKQQMKNLDRFRQEIAIMKMMDHPNICKLYESFEDNRKIYLVMELCIGGELFDRIIDSGHFTEQQAAHTMQHMFRAIFYMHESHICHRDLKPENFLFTTKEAIEKCYLKVIDFGLACKFEANQVLTTKAGTPYYVAPQVLAGKYGQESDLWSLGVIMFVLLCGYPPFHGDTDADVLAKVRLGNFTFATADWKHISDDAKTLIRALLKMNPKDRYTAEQALNHTWVKDKAPKGTGEVVGSGLVDKLRGFRSQNKLKKAALHVIANQLDEKQIKALRDVFMELDANGDGLLTPAELKEGLAKAGLKDIPLDLQEIMKDVDADGSGVIDYTEFLASTVEKKVFMQEDVIWQAFRVFDRNGDGKISADEIRAVLGDPEVKDVMAVEELANIMKEVDSNGDGEIDFEEFTAMMKGNNK